MKFLMLELEEKIKAIHESNLFGSIIELGCAATLAQSLMAIEGSSKTIFKTFQPYSRDIQKKLYASMYRSISKEFVRDVLFKECLGELYLNTNFCYVAS